MPFRLKSKKKRHNREYYKENRLSILADKKKQYQERKLKLMNLTEETKK